MKDSRLRPLFARLADECRADPQKAVGYMTAVCDTPHTDNFLAWSVSAGDPPFIQIPVEQNERLGGSGAAPCPGDLLTMALAACMDGAIRMVADTRGVSLDSIRVEATNRADLRAILGVEDLPEPPDIGFSMHVQITPASGESRERVEKMLAIAEASSAVLGFFRLATDVKVTSVILGP